MRKSTNSKKERKEKKEGERKRGEMKTRTGRNGRTLVLIKMQSASDCRRMQNWRGRALGPVSIRPMRNQKPSITNGTGARLTLTKDDF